MTIIVCFGFLFLGLLIGYYLRAIETTETNRIIQGIATWASSKRHLIDSIKAWVDPRKGPLSAITLIMVMAVIFASVNINREFSFRLFYRWLFEGASWMFQLLYVVLLFLLPIGFILACYVDKKGCWGRKSEELNQTFTRVWGIFCIAFVFFIADIWVYQYAVTRYQGMEIYDRITGEPLKRHIMKGDILEIFPGNTDFHPTSGDRLEVLTKEVLKGYLGSTDITTLLHEQDSFAVLANQPWTKSQHQVNVGDVVEIQANGTISTNLNAGRIDPTGIKDEKWMKYNFLSEFGHAALIARIGNQGIPFYVGGRLTLRVTEPGILYFGINDDVLIDNSGTFSVRVRNMSAPLQLELGNDPNKPLMTIMRNPLGN